MPKFSSGEKAPKKPVPHVEVTVTYKFTTPTDRFTFWDRDHDREVTPKDALHVGKVLAKLVADDAYESVEEAMRSYTDFPHDIDYTWEMDIQDVPIDPS